MNTFVNLPPEVTLLRWVNYHLEEAGHHRRVFNFNEDVKVFFSFVLFLFFILVSHQKTPKDSENYIVLLNQLDPQSCDKGILQQTQDPYARADYMLQQVFLSFFFLKFIFFSRLFETLFEQCFFYSPHSNPFQG